MLNISLTFVEYLEMRQNTALLGRFQINPCRLLSVRCYRVKMMIPLFNLHHDHDHDHWPWPWQTFKIMISGQFCTLAMFLWSIWACRLAIRKRSARTVLQQDSCWTHFQNLLFDFVICQIMLSLHFPGQPGQHMGCRVQGGGWWTKDGGDCWHHQVPRPPLQVVQGVHQPGLDLNDASV